jgi:hypothetical protein
VFKAKKAWQRQILQLIPGGESSLEPGMKRVQWTCVSLVFLIPEYSLLIAGWYAIGNIMMISMRLGLAQFGTCKGP